jgi:hypothetical protein
MRVQSVAQRQQVVAARGHVERDGVACRAHRSSPGTP